MRDPAETEPRPTFRATVIVEAPQVVTSADTATSSPVNSAAASSWEPGAIAWAEMIPGYEDGLSRRADRLRPPRRWHGAAVHVETSRRRSRQTCRFAVGAREWLRLLREPIECWTTRCSKPSTSSASTGVAPVCRDRRSTASTTTTISMPGTDITPDDDGERQQIIDLAEEFADACVANNAEIIQFIGTNNAARDIDSIRQALGEDEISYYSYWDEGYGSELGGVWATMFPTTVRAAVLDAAPDPNNDGNQGARAGRGLRERACEVPRRVQRTPWLCLSQRRRRRSSLRRVDAATRRDTDPKQRRTARHHPWRRPLRRHARAMVDVNNLAVFVRRSRCRRRARQRFRPAAGVRHLLQLQR